MRSHNWTHFLI